MEKHSLQHSQEHFQQAHGTPFTTPLLNDLLGFNGLTPFGDQIFVGAPIPTDLAIDQATWLLLKHQQNLLQPMERTEHPFEFKPLMWGFRCWPEWTTMSPSGCHLGVYKALLKDQPPSNSPPKYVPWMHSIDIMCYIYHLMQLAIKHTFPYECWWIVWNMYLKKEPGNLRIDKLCTLHLFEADYNLLLRWHSSQGFLPRAKLTGCIHDSQGGGCLLEVQSIWHARRLHYTIRYTWHIHHLQSYKQGCCQVLQPDDRSMHEYLLSSTRSRHTIPETPCCLANNICNTLSNSQLAYQKITTNIQHRTHGMEQAKANSLIIAYESMATPLMLQMPDYSISFTQLLDAFIYDTSIIKCQTKTSELSRFTRHVTMESWCVAQSAAGQWWHTKPKQMHVVML